MGNSSEYISISPIHAIDHVGGVERTHPDHRGKKDQSDQDEKDKSEQDQVPLDTVELSPEAEEIALAEVSQNIVDLTPHQVHRPLLDLTA